MARLQLDADVVVVGFGIAGASAAVAAADAGASVALVEKTSHPGGNALYAAGFMFEPPADAAVEFVDSLCFGKTDRDVIEAYVDGLREVPSWIEELGGKTSTFEPPPFLAHIFPGWPHLPGGDRVRLYMLDSEGADLRKKGRPLFELLAANVDRRDIDVMLETAVGRLLADDSGRIVGVEAERDREKLEIHARGGVVLACGGFEGDPGLRDAYLPIPIKGAVGHQHNTGDALRMSQEIGAAIWHMSGHFGWFGFLAEGYGAAFPIDVQGFSQITIDRDGLRFCDETGVEKHDRLKSLTTYLPRRRNRPCLPMYAIFDERARTRGPISGTLATPNPYQWSESNEAEIEKGWIKQADSARALAGIIGVDPDNLEATIGSYNKAARGETNDEFGRRPAMAEPLDLEGPLYAIELVPALATTAGGPRRDGDARVLRPDRSAVPGLFAAGQAGAIWGHSTEHGGALTDAMVFGRKAGRNAAADAFGPRSITAASRPGELAGK